jgi:hypothetical protein
LVEPERWWAALSLVALGGAALGLFWVAASWSGPGWAESVVLASLGCVCGFMAVRGGPRLSLKGDSFELQGVFKNARGRAAEFLGWSSSLRGGILLLRREDLRWVHLPQTMPGSDDAVTLRWALTFLPSVDSGYRRQLRGAAEPSRKLAISRLQAPLAASSSNFEASPRDLELASAALAVAKHGYVEARGALHAVVEALPLPSVSAPYVMDALRVVGDASSAALLAHLAPKYDTRGRGHYARALCELATTQQRDLLQELSLASDLFVRCAARRALARLAAGA